PVGVPAARAVPAPRRARRVERRDDACCGRARGRRRGARNGRGAAGRLPSSDPRRSRRLRRACAVLALGDPAVIARPFGRTGAEVSVIGQGTWRMGERPGADKAEVAALRLGIELGMTHIDSAELYADGGAERVVATAIRGRRDDVFVATKVLPQNASYAGTIASCEASLER